MKEGDIVLLLQLIRTMKELSEEIEKSYDSGKYEKLEAMKRELLRVQEQIGRLL